MEQLRNNLFKLINEAGQSLPPEAIYYICKDFFREVQDEYRNYLSAVAQAAQMKENKEEEQDG